MRGGFSDYKLNREGVDLPLSCLFLPSIHQKSLKIKLHLGYKSGVSVTKLDFSVTKTAFRLQICSCQFTKLHLDLQNGVSRYY